MKIKILLLGRHHGGKQSEVSLKTKEVLIESVCLKKRNNQKQ